jgi:5'-nucleotidase
MNILLSNDDGVHAQGINILNDELSKSFSTIVIAPDKERSSCGHGITLGDPIRVKEIKKDIYSCSGFPADCILIGIGSTMKDVRPDLVISGINHGANLGQDRFYSGTIAAAREAAFRGLKSIAVSLVTKSLKDVEHFDTASEFVSDLVNSGIHKLIPEMCVLNINVPNVSWENVAGLKYTYAGFQNYTEEVVERVDTRGRKYFWVGGMHNGHISLEGSDCNALAENCISVNLQNHTGKEIDIDSLNSFINELKVIKWKRNLHFIHL